VVNFFVKVVGGKIILFVPIFYVPYKKLNKLIKKPSVSSAILCFVVIIILALGTFFIAQITIKEAFNLYMSIQKLDIFNLINAAFLKIFPESPELTRQITVVLQQTLVSLTNIFVNKVGKFLTEAPQIFIQLFITFFVMFYFLKDGEKVSGYLREILPFSHKINERFIKRSRDLTYAVIYGQIIIGLIQGIVAGIGFYIFHAPSPLFFTLLAVFLAILPFVGPWLVWIPVSLVMIMEGNYLSGILLIVFGIIVVGTVDDVVRPFIVGKRGKINPLVVLIGMLGGLVFLGPIGLIVGPIILEYLTIFVELYRRERE